MIYPVEMTPFFKNSKRVSEESKMTVLPKIPPAWLGTNLVSISGPSFMNDIQPIGQTEIEMKIKEADTCH